MNQQSSTVEQVVMGLALLKVSCPDTDNEGDPDGAHALGCFGGCHGTGQVAEFPMLQGPCPGVHTKEERTKLANWVIWESCEKHGCPGFLPVATTDALLEAGKRHGFWLNWSEGLQHWIVAIASLTLGLKVVGSGDTKEMALALALCKAKGIEEVG